MGSFSADKIFNDSHLDVMKELGSMGTAHAATALAKLINRKVTMPVPNVSWIEFSNVADFMGGPESIIVGILVSVTGQIQGMMMFLMPMESARSLTKAFLGKERDTQEEDYAFDDMERSVIEEVGNIMISSYLSSMAGLTNINFKPSVPFVSIDMAQAILSVPAIEFGKMADRVLFLESQIQVQAEEGKADVDCSGCFILVPNLHSFFRILRALGVE
ncbi:MAG: chemotaxis protein CheC [Defluviitaleaceae bacterium]|nr:chemotaxis protein CheC [Defluviitaleaceae bacterium]MCL2275848.1 chemotaxis protein CheC [Defluviitaleaceae bacterium]